MNLFIEHTTEEILSMIDEIENKKSQSVHKNKEGGKKNVIYNARNCKKI